MHTSDWVGFAVGLPSAAAVLWSVLRYLPARLRAIDARVAAVEAQHLNNGGATVRDAIDRIEATGVSTQKMLFDHVVDEARRSGGYEARLSELEK